MMRDAIAIVFGIIAVAAAPLGATAAGDADSTTEDAAPAMEILAAPGGGEMVILGAESRYVTRASRDGAGRVRAGCARKAGAPSERVPDRKQP
jgi:hypothetical protein